MNVIAPGTEYGDRLNQLDFRVGKIAAVRPGRVALNVDMFNVFNDNAVLTENAQLRRVPTAADVLNPRLVKFSVNLDF